MRITHFKGTGIRGYMDFDIHFKENLHFLIGINGSGKTTVLKLISALITPSYFDLSQIEFKEIELELLQDNNTTIVIKCSKNEKQLSLKCESVEGQIPISVLRFRNNPYPIEFLIDKMRNDLMHFEEESVVKKIRSLETPLFLGLNRRFFDNPIMQIEKDAMITRRMNPNIDSLFDSVDRALRDIQDMFNEVTRNNSRSQYALADRFRKDVFEESFKIQTISSFSSEQYKSSLAQLNEKKKTLYNAIELLGMDKLKSSFNEFFDKMSYNLNILNETSSLDESNKPNDEYYNAFINWVLNSEQLKRIDSIITLANEYSNSLQTLKKPFNRFVDSVNLFFSEGNKQIRVEESGDIKILIGQKKNTIYELSSGEKQLIIILAHVAFYKKLNRNSAPVFIIDEPELSLHISWQEKFVDALIKANPDTQFIMATHAPAIISRSDRKQLCIDLSNTK
ncbi:MAG: AAA family ATPase [Paludibacteraceae bacterium]|nr:AAA family ATPase [Paludibacteraceae bacterium]